MSKYLTRLPVPNRLSIRKGRIVAHVTVDKIQAVLDRYPDLCEDGMCNLHSIGESDKLLANQYLVDRLVTPVAILVTIPRGKTPTCSSYGLKHLIEDIVGYLTNGEMIVAAALAQFRITHPGGPNVMLNIQRSWVTAQYDRINGRTWV